MKTCSACGEAKERSGFNVQRSSRDGLHSLCRECDNARCRAYRVGREDRLNAVSRLYRATHVDELREYHRAYAIAHPERWAKLKAGLTPLARSACNALNAEIARGRLVRPNVCEECGKAKFTEGAHSDYTKPLTVRWLCRSCHRRWDWMEPKGGVISAPRETSITDDTR